MKKLFVVRFEEKYYRGGDYPDEVVVDILCQWTDTIITCIYKSVEEMFEKLPIKLKELRES